MQPWRPRPGVFTAYEEKWRAERNLLVEKSNAAKALKARRPPRALNRRQSNVFDNLTESKQQVWHSWLFGNASLLYPMPAKRAVLSPLPANPRR